MFLLNILNLYSRRKYNGFSIGFSSWHFSFRQKRGADMEMKALRHSFKLLMRTTSKNWFHDKASRLSSINEIFLE